jgi:hypothetical protein
MPSLTPVKIFKGEPVQIILESNFALDTNVTPVYTVAAGKRLILKYIRVTSIDTTTANINVKSGTSPTASTGDFILRNAEVLPYDVVIFEMNEVIEEGEKIFLWEFGRVSVQISGVEVTL